MVMMMSLSHTQARKEANERGARIATSVMLADEEEMTDIMERGLSADYERIKERTERLALRLTNGRRATVKTPWGTDVTMSIEGRAGEADTGIFRQPGSFGNLPAGEAYIAPVEGSANGTIAIDMVMTGVGWFESEKTLILKVKEGYVVDVEGERAPVLSSILATYGKAARNIAELGVGTNDRARANKPIECEKTMGTVHMALGDNSTFGGVVECPVHLDGIMSKPTLTIDDEVIIEDGEYLL
jgi:leucyl aminopeptidase (aminopeptidase T)